MFICRGPYAGRSGDGRSRKPTPRGPGAAGGRGPEAGGRRAELLRPRRQRAGKEGAEEQNVGVAGGQKAGEGRRPSR